MEWWQTLLITVVPAMVAAGALLVQQGGSRRQALELWRAEADARVAEARAERVRGLHTEVLTHMSRWYFSLSTAAEAVAAGGAVPPSFTTEAGTVLAQLQMLYGRIRVESSNESQRAMSNYLDASGNLLRIVEGADAEHLEARVYALNEAMETYADVAREDANPRHAAPAKARRRRGTTSATRAS